MGIVKLARKKSPWILHYNTGSCNACDIEILDVFTPLWDVERFGVVNVGNPKQADVIVVTGPVNKKAARVLRNLYEQTPEPKVVVVIGICGTSGGVFNGCPNVLGGVDNVIPVDVYVQGCPATPEQIIDGIVEGLRKLEEKTSASEAKAK